MKYYNIYTNWSYTESVLKGRFLCNAKRNQKNSVFLRGIQFDPLRWDVADSGFLSKAGSQEAFAGECSLFPEEPRLSSIRTYPDSKISETSG